MADKNEYVSLRDGAKMPIVGLGTWLSKPGQVSVAVYEALKSGYRHIDGAAAYANESEVGEGLKKAIDEGIVSDASQVWLTSKLPVTRFAPDAVRPQCEKTLKDLGVTSVDLYLAHWPFELAPTVTAFPPAKEDIIGYDAERFLATWREMEKLQDDGLVKHIGVSNFSSKKLETLIASARITPYVNQVESHPFLPQNSLRATCTKHNIVITAYSPLGNPSRPERVRNDDDPHLLAHEVVTSIANELNVGAANVLIRYQIQRGVVVIPKSVTPSRIASNFDVFDFALTDSQMEKLANLSANGTKRLLRGDTFAKEGQDWTDLWDGEA